MAARQRADFELEGRVRDLTAGGEAVVETARGIVLARGALPGERVRVRLGGRGGGAQRGSVLALLERSAERVEAPCPLQPRCGGCPLMTLAEPAALRFKQERLSRLLSRLGWTLQPALFASPHALGYRTRARLAWQRDGERGAICVGYHAPGSRRLLEVDSCAVLGPVLAGGYAALRARLAPALHGRGEIALGVGTQQGCVAELSSAEPQPPAAYAAAEALVAGGGLRGLALRVGEGVAAVFGDGRLQAPGSDGEPLWAPAGAFTQANPEVNARLAAQVLALAQPQGARVLELYAGHGNLSVGLARDCAELRAVESDRAAAEACRQNLRERGLTRAKVVCDDAAHGALGKGAVDVVVLDPPRAGARAALPAIVGRKPARIVYVSCELTTLGRDLGELARSGYRADAAALFDMFPMTAHLESVVRLVRT